MSASDLFSDDFTAARRRFVAAHEKRARWRRHYPLEQAGLDGQSLGMDAAWIGPDAPDVVLLTVSGTHGAEGYCGSAMQTHAVEAGLFNHLPPGVAVLQLHAVNPYGMACFVRTTEEGVDLNRNWIDFAAPPPSDPLVQRVIAALPQRCDPVDEVFAEWEKALGSLVKDHGRRAIDNALTRGQYEFAEAPGFGGFAATRSRQVIEAVLAELPLCVRHIAYIDWHSLLRTGDGTLIYLCFNEPGSALFDRTARWWGRDAIARDAVNRQWQTGTSAGDERAGRCGLMMWGLRNRLAPRVDLAGAVVEFCTEPDPALSPDQSWARETVAECYLRTTRDFSSELGRRARAELQRALYPDSEAFRAGMLKAGGQALTRCLKGAGHWAAEDVSADCEPYRVEGEFR